MATTHSIEAGTLIAWERSEFPDLADVTWKRTLRVTKVTPTGKLRVTSDVALYERRELGPITDERKRVTRQVLHQPTSGLAEVQDDGRIYYKDGFGTPVPPTPEGWDGMANEEITREREFENGRRFEQYTITAEQSGYRLAWYVEDGRHIGGSKTLGVFDTLDEAVAATS